MRYDPRRIEEIIFVDPTRNLQVLGALCAFARAYYTIAFDPFTWAPQTAYIFFYWFPDWAWALALICSGWLQLWAAATRRWKWKYRAASIQVVMLTYSLVVGLITNRGGISIPYIVMFLLMQLHIAGRALHDKEFNGADRRNQEIHA